MAFTRDAHYAAEVGNVFGEYLTTYASANQQARFGLTSSAKGGASRLTSRFRPASWQAGRQNRMSLRCGTSPAEKVSPIISS